MIFSFISVLNSVKTLLILKGVTYEITVTEMFMGMIYFFGRLGWWKLVCCTNIVKCTEVCECMMGCSVLKVSIPVITNVYIWVLSGYTT